MRPFNYLMLLAALSVPVACSVEEGQLVDMAGGTQNVGGTSPKAGSSSTGGNANAAGTGAKAGSSSTGGSAIAVGGTQSAGGASSAGGSKASGGTMALGGAGGNAITGGAKNTGGVSMVSTGGATTSSIGGTNATGGVATIGGFSATGAVAATGGTTSSVSSVNCGVPANPANGTVSAPVTTYNSIASYSCNNGYNLSGVATRKCQSDATWSGTAPTCVCLVGTNDCTGNVSRTCDANGIMQNSPACQNPACLNILDVCEPAAPSTWLGPIALYEGSPSAIPACSAPFSSAVFTLYANPVQTPAQCSTCSCSQIGVAGCSVNNSFHWGVCPDTGGSGDLEAMTGTCYTWAASIGVTTSTNMAAEYSTVGTYVNCSSPSAQTPTLPTPTWSNAALGCALPFPSANGCESGQVCSPIPSLPYNGKICVYQVGDVACPGSPYTAKRTYYTDNSDGRGCSDCGCSMQVAPTCTNVTVHAYSDTNCTNQIYAVNPPIACVASTGALSFTATATCTGGSCGASGGQPTGSITPTNPTTICCTP